ncbi:CoA-transferase [Sphingobium yanoikuyae]|jgi:crotonobetainyl-CoA:carnitine CoA-transferase CaiB-like acyl-CoA transferase|uniref:CoA-transferase n=1 Tax=Sphingobium yanoikuyae TaxID=13690 RepID=A0A177JVJ3_SPHYA|nr:CoA transferase [Sphingobium yanoikuyae]OAH45250.1 CoA-transferase [Sphingobium yanoikuyae]
MQPLAGVRILDLSNVLAGPFCAYYLASLGAEVIKVEKPDGGDLARSLGADPAMAAKLQGLSFVAVNAGKQSVALDLKTEDGKEALRRLVDCSDALIESYRPGVMERLGLGATALRARNPKLIYCAISGFGQDGPWRGRPAYDQIVQGLSGAMSVTGDENSAPMRSGFPMADTIGGLNAAVAISAALVRQRTTGEGETIDVSMLESTLAAMGWVVSNHLNGGVDPKPIGNQNFTAAPSGTFRTADAPINIAANEQRQFESLCDLLDRPELKTDPRFAVRQARKENRDALNREVEAGLSTDTAKAWEERLNAAGVPCGRVMTVPDILQEAQIADRDFVRAVGGATSKGAPLRVTRPGFSLSEPFPIPALPPELGADTRHWLEKIGMQSEETTA